MRIDFHVHTGYSIDSIIRPEDLARKSKKLGIIPTIADHNSMSGCAHMRSLGAGFIPGEEIGTDRGDLIGLYLTGEIPKHTPFAEALDKIHEQGGLAYLPHMYESSRSGVLPTAEETKKIDIIEVFNARCLSNRYNEEAESFAEKHGKLKAAGSDSHFLFEFGSTYTEVPDFDINNPKELLKALEGASFVKRKAPIFVRGPTELLGIGKTIVKSVRR
jgi:predicted metal-dependent phosphoesterase TrpH